MSGKVRCSIESHSDFSMRWDNDFEGSISIARYLGENGVIMMKYSEVPYLLYLLAKGLGYGFLKPEDREEILGAEEVRFAACSYKEVRTMMENSREHNSHVWTGMFEGHPIDPKRLNDIRKTDGIAAFMSVLQEKGIDPAQLTYVGRVHSSPEYPYPIHIAASIHDDTYISQGLSDPGTVRLNREQREGAVKDIVDLYGIVVSAALRSLIQQ